jgi:hypothetical protein
VRHILVLTLALAGGVAHAEPAVTIATPTSAPITIDGRLDEPAWSAAVPNTRFWQLQPNEGAAPSEPTELRVLYDARTLYIGVICHDSGSPNRRLNGRDDPNSDGIEVSIDFAHDHRTAYVFGVTAGGVQYDGLVYGDNHFTFDWDAVWDSAATVQPGRWSVEIAIPLHVFRRSAAAEQLWGFHAQRFLIRKHEVIGSTMIPRKANGFVSELGHLAGLHDLAVRGAIDLLPYAAARLQVRPKLSDTATPRLVDPTLDVGLDLRAGLTSGLQLNATLNPDFGQVESDQIILNLSNQEAFFPEKRPFFFQGTEVFQTVSAGVDDPPAQALFYSRRIGLDTPILGALKVTGEVGSRLQVGLLEALVMSPSDVPSDENAPDRRLGFHPQRPFRLSPNDAFTGVSTVTENYLAGVMEYKLGKASAVGARFASGVPISELCTAAEAALDDDHQPDRCKARGGNAGAIDWDLRTNDSAWVLLGQAEASSSLGGPPVRVLPDGVRLGRGGAGWGGFVEAGKMGGEPWRFDLAYTHLSPTLDLNAIGFQPLQNLQQVSGIVHYIKPVGFGRLHYFEIASGGRIRWSTDGNAFNRGRHVFLNVSTVLPRFDAVGFEVGVDPPYLDTRELTEKGVPFERPGMGYLVLFGNSDSNRVLSVNGSVALGFHAASPVTPARPGWTADVTGFWRPGNHVDSRLSFSIDRTPHGPRWTGDDPVAGRFLFGDLRSELISLTLRQQVFVHPRLTLRAYAQLFSAYGRYLGFLEGGSPEGRPVLLRDLAPTDKHHPGFHNAGLNVNLVMRWEYRLGSMLYLVYTHSGHTLDPPDGVEAPATLSPVGLSSGPATDGLMVKWARYWDL